jgi:nitrite reductase/ring-hydroxylating ferredoxin subunit
MRVKRRKVGRDPGRAESRRSGECYPVCGEHDERRSRSRLDLIQWIEVETAPDGGILAGVVDEDRVFVWRNGNRLKAYNADCPHLGGTLNKGVVAGATIRCPWHHACFDLATGEATAAPAFDALLEYPVTFDNDRFCVKPARPRTPRRTSRRDDSLGTMAIVGGGAAGFAAADAIRKLGWRGGLTIFS